MTLVKTFAGLFVLMTVLPFSGGVGIGIMVGGFIRAGFKALLWIGRKQRNEMDVAGGLIRLALGKLSHPERRYVLNAAQLEDLGQELGSLGVTLSAAAPGERTH